MTATPEQRAAARAYMNGALSLDLSDLADALNAAYGDSYTAGLLVAAQQTGGVTSALGDVATPTTPQEWTSFWDAWKPGNAPAADLLNNGGLADLLARTDTTISGIEGTTLDRLGTLLADGVANGDSVDEIAATLGDFIDNPDRAYQIADTEIARCVSQASADGYAAAGVTEWEWLLSPGACPECQEMESSNPHSEGDELPPLHPVCRCSISPIAPDSE